MGLTRSRIKGDIKGVMILDFVQDKLVLIDPSFGISFS